MRTFLVLVFIAALIAGIVVYRDPKRLGMDRWALNGFLDQLVASSPKLRESRLSSLLDERIGGCEAKIGAMATKSGEQWEVAPDSKVPFAVPIKLSGPISLGFKNNVLSDVVHCQDSMGNEFRIRQDRGQIILRLDRASGSPIRVNLLSSGNIQLAGKNLYLLLHSPLGDLSVRSLANTEISVDISGGQDLSLFDENISVRTGKVRVERISKEPLGADAGMLRLSAEKNGELQWEEQHEPVVAGRSATVLPSGFYWDKPINQPSLELTH